MKVWYLAILVFGEVVYQSPDPMTATDCALQVAYKIIEIEQYAKSGRPVPKKYGGDKVKLSDVEVKCLRRVK